MCIFLCVDKIFSKKSHKILSFTLISLFAMLPLYKSDFNEYYSFIKLLYAFFDRPCIFAFLLLSFGFFKNIVKINTKFNPYIFIFLCFLIAILYLINLDLLRLKIELNPLFLDPILIFLFLLSLYLFDKSVAYIALVSVFVAFLLGENVFYELFCVYSFVFYLLFTLYFLLKKLKKA